MKTELKEKLKKLGCTFRDCPKCTEAIDVSTEGSILTFTDSFGVAHEYDLLTYDISLSGATLTLTGSDGSTSEVDLSSLIGSGGTLAYAVNGVEQILDSSDTQLQFTVMASTPDVTVSNNSFNIQTSGVYKLTYKVNMEDRQNARQNVSTVISINGMPLEISRSYTYIRNTSDGLATATFHGIHAVQAGDIVTFHSAVIPGNPGNVAILAGESFFQVEYIPHIAVGTP